MLKLGASVRGGAPCFCSCVHVCIMGLQSAEKLYLRVTASKLVWRDITALGGNNQDAHDRVDELDAQQRIGSDRRDGHDPDRVHQPVVDQQPETHTALNSPVRQLLTPLKC